MKKQTLKKILAVALAAVMTVGMSACGSKTESGAEESVPAEASTEQSVEESQKEETPEEPEAEVENAADMVLTNGNIITMVSEDDRAEAVAVKDGEIIYVGTADGAADFIGSETNVIDLEGQTVTPGLIDGHTHPGSITAIPSLYLDETDADVELYKEVFTQFLEDNKDYDFVIINGTGLNLNAFENAIPTNEWLDEICPDIPVCIQDMSYHGYLLNSKAVEICGITKDTQPDLNGIIYKDADGEPTGFISDCPNLMSELPVEEEDMVAIYKDSMVAYQEEANSYGITAVDIGGNLFARDENDMINEARGALDDLAKEGTLTIRVNMPTFATKPFTKEEAEKQVKSLDEGQKYNSDFQRVTQVKCQIDGVPEACTSALLEPYAPEAGQAADYTGPEITPQEDFNQFVATMNAAGYAVNTHSMGDLSVRTALEAIEYSIEQNGEGDYRNIITHMNLINGDDVERVAATNTYAAMQPLWWYYDPIFSPLEEHTLGAERFATEYHIKDLVDAGIKITGSVDYPVTLDFAPLHGIEAGATQCSPFEGEEGTEEFTRNADQAVSVYEMLKMYTINGAEQMSMDDLIGTIEVGKKADFTVLEDDILSCELEHISDIKIVKTISDGRIVYEG